MKEDRNIKTEFQVLQLNTLLKHTIILIITWICTEYILCTNTNLSFDLAAVPVLYQVPYLKRSNFQKQEDHKNWHVSSVKQDKILFIKNSLNYTFHSQYNFEQPKFLKQPQKQFKSVLKIASYQYLGHVLLSRCNFYLYIYKYVSSKVFNTIPVWFQMRR